jgi:multidrug efflux pump subunit AcrA (membrane-fusion protein)
MKTLSFLALVVLASCGTQAPKPQAEAPAAAPSADITLTSTARENLGITFAKVQYRVVQGTVRYPGRFETEASARHSYQTPIAGRVEVLVRPYQFVAAGDPLYRIESEEWQRLQVAIAEGCNDRACGGDCAATGTANKNLAAGEQHLEASAQALQAWTERAKALEKLDKELGGKAAERAEVSIRIAELGLQVSEAQQQLAKLKREAQGPDGSSATGLAAVRLRQIFALATAITGLSRKELEARDDKGIPRWLSLDAPLIRASAPGCVESAVLTTGTWTAAHTTVLTVTNPSVVRFEAAGLQADLPRLKPGLTGHVVAHDPANQDRIPVDVSLAPLADAIDRSVLLIARTATGAALPHWVRPGVTALLEIAISGSTDEELAIPLACLVPEGLERVFFRRDPAHPELLKRVIADLGVSDGRWVVLQSGVKEGDEVVLGGVHPLALSTRAPVAGAAKPDPHASCGGH